MVLAVAALAAAGVALAEVQDRIVLRGTGGNDLAHYSPSLAAVAVSPPEYARGCCYDSDGGEWTGPRYQATGLATLGGNSAIDWGVGVAVRVRDTRAALIANLTHDWPVVSEGQQQVEHRVGGRAAGTIGGFWVLTRSPFGGADDARMEAAVGFPLCDGNTAYAKFSLLLPSGDSAGGTIGFGEYLINGMRPTVWNAEKAMQAIRGVRLEGNRPATQVTSAARGGRVSGRVADCDGHPVAGLSVRAPAADRPLVANGLVGPNQRGRHVLARRALRRDVPRARGDADERVRACRAAAGARAGCAAAGDGDRDRAGERAAVHERRRCRSARRSTSPPAG